MIKHFKDSLWCQRKRFVCNTYNLRSVNVHFIYLTDGGQLDITAQLLYILWKIYSIYVRAREIATVPYSF